MCNINMARALRQSAAGVLKRCMWEWKCDNNNKIETLIWTKFPKCIWAFTAHTLQCEGGRETIIFRYLLRRCTGDALIIKNVFFSKKYIQSFCKNIILDFSGFFFFLYFFGNLAFFPASLTLTLVTYSYSQRTFDTHTHSLTRYAAHLSLFLFLFHSFLCCSFCWNTLYIFFFFRNRE